MEKIEIAITTLIAARDFAAEFANADAYVNPLLVILQGVKANMQEKSIYDGVSEEDLAEILAAEKLEEAERLQAEAATIYQQIRAKATEGGETEEVETEEVETEIGEKEEGDDDDSERTDDEPAVEPDKTDGEPAVEGEKTDGEPAVGDDKTEVEPIVNVVEPVVLKTDLGDIPMIEPVIPIVPIVKKVTVKSRKTPALEKVKGAAMEPSI
jgi:hypothetical protein